MVARAQASDTVMFAAAANWVARTPIALKTKTHNFMLFSNEDRNRKPGLAMVAALRGTSFKEAMRGRKLPAANAGFPQQ
jgi:hypothetical protein